MRLRKANEAELVPQLRAALLRHGAREWEAIFGTRVPCTVVRGIEEVFDDEQVAHQGLLATHAHPTLGSYRAVVEPIRFNGERGVKREARAPMLGSIRCRSWVGWVSRGLFARDLIVESAGHPSWADVRWGCVDPAAIARPMVRC